MQQIYFITGKKKEVIAVITSNKLTCAQKPLGSVELSLMPRSKIRVCLVGIHQKEQITAAAYYRRF